jgi:dTDP-4-amino-4,6-dideoxygalactose transaminase
MIYYSFPLHQMKVFQGKMAVYGKLTNTEEVAQEVLSLPIEPLQTEEETSYVIKTIRTFYKKVIFTKS